MKIILSHPTGNANVRATARALLNANLLAKFITSIASFSGSMLDNLSFFKPLSAIRRRSYDSALKDLTITSPWREAARLAAAKFGLGKLIEHEKGVFSIDSIYQNLDKKVATTLERSCKRNVKGVYAYEDGAVHSFRIARSLGLQCFYDLPTGYWRAASRLLEKEKEQWPEWISTMTGFDDSEKKLAQKDEELRLANCVLVASEFTVKTLKEYPGNLPHVELIPYGFPQTCPKENYPQLSRSRPLKLLFIGKLSQQKGIADLFTAVEEIGTGIELTVVGRKPTEKCYPLNLALAKHRWIPTLSHQGILRCMQEHDVLVFPSLFDGFGLVITEAMSQGIPVIASDRSAGPSLISHDQNGWLVQAGSIQDLKNAIENLLYKPNLIKATGLQAIESAKKRPWLVYETELANAVNKQLISFT